MKSSDVFPSKYLKAEDVEEDLTVTISSVTMEEVKDKDSGKTTQKPCIHFKELSKSILCNKTNWGLIARQHGEESDGWAGKQIILTVMDVDSFGDIVSAIRVKAPQKSKPKPDKWDENNTGPDEVSWLENSGYLPANTHPRHIINLLNLSPFRPGDQLVAVWFDDYKKARGAGADGPEAAKVATEAWQAVP